MLCPCEVKIGRTGRIFQRFCLCYSYARSRDMIRVLLQDSFCPSYRGSYLRDADVPG
jgi:hypothetical protein